MVDVERRIDRRNRAGEPVRVQHLGGNVELVDVGLPVAGAVDAQVRRPGGIENVRVELLVPAVDLDRLRGVDAVVRSRRLIQFGGPEIGDKLGELNSGDRAGGQRSAAGGDELRAQAVGHLLQRDRAAAGGEVAVVHVVQPHRPGLAVAWHAAQGERRVPPCGGPGDRGTATHDLRGESGGLLDRDESRASRADVHHVATYSGQISLQHT